MSRQELVKKYLAVTAHLNAQEKQKEKQNEKEKSEARYSRGKKSASRNGSVNAGTAGDEAKYYYRSRGGGSGGRDNDRKRDDADDEGHFHSAFYNDRGPKADEQDRKEKEVAARWLFEWNERMKAERQRDRDREERSKNDHAERENDRNINRDARDRNRDARDRNRDSRKRDGASSNCYHASSGDTAAAGEGVGVGVDTDGGVSRDGGGMRDYRAEAADSARRLRVSSLASQLPTMAIGDLRKLMTLR
jgi:hypothetical protein